MGSSNTTSPPPSQFSLSTYHASDLKFVFNPFLSLKELSHEMDLAFNDMYGYFRAKGEDGVIF